MTPSRDPDRLLRAFLREGDEDLHDRVYDAVRGAIEQKPQRVVIGPWRIPEMTKFVTIGLVAAAAVLVVVVIGMQSLGAPTNVGRGGDATPTPAATSTEVPTPTPEPSTAANLPSWYTTTEEPTGAGMLDPGSHETTSFSPGFTYTVPRGWVNPMDTSGYFELFRDHPWNEASFERSQLLAENIVMGMQPAPWFTCESLEDNRGATAAEIVAAASANDVLEVSDRGAVEIGGLTGRQISVQRNPDWTGDCPDDAELPAGLDPDDERTTAFLLDVPDRGVLVILVYSQRSADVGRALREAMPIIESFEFAE